MEQQVEAKTGSFGQGSYTLAGIFLFVGLSLYVSLMFAPDWNHWPLHSRGLSLLLNAAWLCCFYGEWEAQRAGKSRFKFPVFSVLGAFAFILGFKAGGIVAVVAFLLWSMARGRGLFARFGGAAQ